MESYFFKFKTILAAAFWTRSFVIWDANEERVAIIQFCRDNRMNNGLS